MLNPCCVIFVLYLVSITGATESSIVGGKEVKPHSRPYMVSLQNYGQHTCGGFLIRKDFVLTAAHCKESQPLKVVAGAHCIAKREASQQWINVAKYIQHPEYIPGKYNNDIMLLKLKTDVKLNKYVKTIRLPRKSGKIPANINCSADGWGLTSAKGKGSSDVLKEATERLQFNSECRIKWKEYFNDTTMICTKFDKIKGGVCQGDSGGPLICNKTPQGITAFTYRGDCSNPKFPHVFTKVSFYIPWIEKTMKRFGNVA